MADVQIDHAEQLTIVPPRANYNDDCDTEQIRENLSVKSCPIESASGLDATDEAGNTTDPKSASASRLDDVGSQPNLDGSGDGKGGDHELANRDANEREAEELEKELEDDDKDGWIFVLGHNQLKKRTVKPGEPNSRPNKGQVVTVRCVGRLDDGTEVDRRDDLKLCLGDDDFITAFDLCLTLMDKGETCEIVTEARFAYGESGREPDIPPNARITYEVELLTADDLPEFHTMTVAYRVQLSNEKRERGNALYARGEHSRAVDIYNRALKIVDDENEPHVESTTELNLLAETRVKCYNNLAAAQLKVEAWDAAIRSCDLVLRTDPDNVKALFRKGKCLAGKGDYDSAMPILRRALQLEPDSKIIQHELTRIDAKLRESNRSQKELYQKMLGTDKQPFIQNKNKKAAAAGNATKRDTRWIWYVVGALAAAVIPVGLTVYRQFFHADNEQQASTDDA